MIHNIQRGLQNIEQHVETIASENQDIHAVVAIVIIIILRNIIEPTPAIVLAEYILIIALLMILYTTIREGYDKIKG